MNAHTDFEHLYVLRDPLDKRFFRARVQFPREINPNLLFRGDLHVSEPLMIGRAEGRALADIVWTDHVATILISARLAEAFCDQGVSGWSTYPVRFDAEEITGGYFGLSITGRCGAIDSRGEWVRKDNEPGRFLRGMFFDEQSWDGSDVFVPNGSAYPCVTEKTLGCLDRIDARNFKAERLTEVMRPEIVIRNTPKRS